MSVTVGSGHIHGANVPYQVRSKRPDLNAEEGSNAPIKVASRNFELDVVKTRVRRSQQASSWVLFSLLDPARAMSAPT